MSTAGDVLIPTGLVLMGVMLSGVGWVFRRLVNRGEQRNQQDTSQDTRIILLERDVTELREMTRSSAAHRQALSEELAALGAIVDRHEKWHERNDPRHDSVR